MHLKLKLLHYADKKVGVEMLLCAVRRQLVNPPHALYLLGLFHQQWVTLRSMDNAEEDFLSAVLLPGAYVLRFVFDLQFTQWHTQQASEVVVS